MNRREQLLVFGASGHAKDVIGVARDLGYRRFMMATSEGGKGFGGIDEIKIARDLETRFAHWDAIVAIGSNGIREQFMQRFPLLNWVCVVAPTASVDRTVLIGRGTFIAAQVHVGPGSQLGEGVVLNAGAVVGHDGVIGDFSQLAPRATVLGNALLGRGVFLGAGSVVIQGTPGNPTQIASGVNLGMGGLVMQSITEEGARLISKPNTMMVGVPGDEPE